MKNTYRNYVVVAGAVLCGCWTLFGQDKGRDNTAPTIPGRFAVVTGNNETIMYDPQTGQSWKFVGSVVSRALPVWIPIQRLDSKEAVEKWGKQIQQQMRDEDAQLRPNCAGTGAYNSGDFNPSPSLTPPSGPDFK